MHCGIAIRSALLSGVLLVWHAIPGRAQGEGGSLTPEFKHLSAKERSRLARREQEGSAKDTTYQRIMAQAEADFQQKKYGPALAGYQQARARRPLNVYPKVKIDDIKDLIAKRDAAMTDSSAAVAPVLPTGEQGPATGVPGTAVRSEPREARAPPVPRSPGTATIMERPLAPRPAPTTSFNEGGVTERQFREGSAMVLERVVSEEGAKHVYRKVVHGWGQAYYFLDGMAVDVRVWSERFGGR
ncbi:MAG: hypothetical protein H6597_03960 [Flavobacteriales bacterium]|nr:hypothetical protein [Flavobacteriales bacterium]MCB9193665.1 hypothetical protein [Flavobacteriales bacterium]